MFLNRLKSQKYVFGEKLNDQQLEVLKNQIETADAIVIGAGAGLSTAAGLTYSGERFEKYFFDFANEYGIKDMYSGGFYPFEDMETYWAWWSRHIYINRYMDAPGDVYANLLHLLENKDYFVITTNVDHQFQRAHFDKKRLFYMQGDYGLFQSVSPTIPKTYDNQDIIEKMMEAQGFVRNEKGIFDVPEDKNLLMKIPTSLIPKCPDDGLEMIPNLRVDNSFVQDLGWEEAYERYHDFMNHHQNKHILFLELGVGMNTPVIIKYPFWNYVEKNQNAYYACINFGEAGCQESIAKRSILINDDIAKVLRKLNNQ